MTTLSPRHTLKDLGAIVLITTLTACGLAPARTPSPADVSSPESLLRDEFSSASSEWKASPWLQPGPWHGEELSGGEYRMWVDNSQKPYDFSTSTPGRSFGDLRLEVDVRRVSGAEGAGPFLICRLDPRAGSFYYFKLDGKGVAEIGVYLNGEEQHVVGQHLPAGMVKADANHLRADCIGSKLSLYINGQFALDTDEEGYSSGEVGLGTGGAEAGTSEFRFDNFVVYSPTAVVAEATRGVGAGTPTQATSVQVSIPEEMKLHTVEPPPPSDPLEALMARVDAHEMTREQALIAGLRFLAGQADGASTFGGKVPRDLEGTGIVIEAARYLRSGTDTSAKQQIQDLMEIVAPAADRLDAYASPAGTVSLRPPGLANPAADDLCTSLAMKGFPSGSTAKCLFYLEKPLNGAHHARIYYPAAWGKDSPYLAYAAAAGQALSDSWSRYALLGKGKMEDARLVFTLIGAPKGADFLAEVPSDANASTCEILAYPNSLLQELPNFKQTIAHEAFHCYQSWNLPAYFDADWDVQRWWGEATAEYFSNVVYPAVNDEWGRIAEFDQDSAYKSLLLMAYANEPFFQYLADQIGDQGILDLIKTLPTSGGSQAQAQALAGYPDIQKLFHQFARDFVDGKIPDTSKALMPTGPLGIPADFSNTLGPAAHSQASLASWGFTVGRSIVTFKQGRLYAVQSKEAGNAGLYAARLVKAKGAWDALPAQVASGCDDVDFYVLHTTSVPTGGEISYRVDVTADVQEDAACDKCLAGTWELNKDSFVNFLSTPFKNTGNLFSFDSAQGNWTHIYTPGGFLYASYNFAYTYSIHQDLQGQPMDTKVLATANGPSAAIYWVDKSGVLHTHVASWATTFEQNVSVNGNPVASDQFPFPAFFTENSVGQANYICTPKTLQLVYFSKAGALPAPIAYDRIAGPP